MYRGISKENKVGRSSIQIEEKEGWLGPIEQSLAKNPIEFERESKLPGTSSEALVLTVFY